MARKKKILIKRDKKGMVTMIAVGFRSLKDAEKQAKKIL